MYPAPAEPCFFLTKRGLINANLCVCMQRLFHGAVDKSTAWRGKRCTSFGFDCRRGFACDMLSTIGFVKIIEKSKNAGSAGVRYIT